jgi:hypothetical protein
VSIRLEQRGKAMWLLLRPDIWIKPMAMRESVVDFIRDKKLRRYNAQANAILDAWIELLLKTVGTNELVSVTAFPGSAFSAEFTVGTRTAFSGVSRL